MTGCQLTSFDLGECLSTTIFGWVGPFISTAIFYAEITLAVIVLLVILSIFARLRTAFGWPGVIAGLFVFSNAIAAAIGFALRGKIDAGKVTLTAGKPSAVTLGRSGPIPVKKPSAIKPVQPKPPSSPFPFPPFRQDNG